MSPPLQIHEPGQTPLPHARRDLAVGIDLGTTNSLIAIAEGARPVVLRDKAGRGLVPSVVAYVEDRVVVGDEARRIMVEQPDRVVASVKRLMGRGAEDVLRVAGQLPYEVAAAAESGGMVRLRVGGRTLTPVEVSADILRAVKARGEAALGRKVTEAVITVPAHFDDAARTATKDAAKLAGLTALRLVNEPTAAALAYGLDKGAEGLYAVFDLGGGTFDISVLRLQMGVFQVLATGGDPLLGGDDFDQVIAEHFLAERARELGEAHLTTGEAKMALMSARLAKEELTTLTSGEWPIVLGGRTSHHGLDRAKLNELVRPLVDRAIAITQGVLSDARMDPEDVRGVVLVGGSTRVPLVRDMVRELFGTEPLSDIDPDEVVALGAALQAAALTQGSSALLLDVTPLSLGIETMGGLCEKVVPRNTPIPAARAQEFTTYQDGQTAMMIHVVQGERELVTENRSLARFELHGIPAMVAGAARIRVLFAVDVDGLLTVSAEETGTGVRQEVAVKPTYGLSGDEMAGMLRASMEHAREDMDARLLAEARVDADRILIAVDAALRIDGALLSRTERTAIEDQMQALRATAQGHDRHGIADAVEVLNGATEEFAGRRMDREIRSALRGVAVSALEDRVGAVAAEAKK